jgi:hypothetical protein
MATKKKATKAKVEEPVVTEAEIQSTDTALSRGIFIHLSHGMFGIRRRVDPNRIEVKDETPEEKVNKRSIGVTKRLFDSDEYRAMNKTIEESKQFLRARAMHAPRYKAGFYFIPFDKGPETMEGLKEIKAKLEAQAEDFAFKHYRKAKADARKDLGPLWRESDYPSENYVRRSIYMEWEFEPGRKEVPASLANLSADILAAEMQKAAAKARDLFEDMKYAMRAQVQEMVAHLAERLAPDAKGERKVFRESALTNLTEALEFFDQKNTVTTDTQLANLVNTLRKQLAGVNVEELRDDAKYRQNVQRQMDSAKASLDLMLKDKPARLIADRDEEV